MLRLKNPLIRTLRWSEKYTKTDMVYLTHGWLWLIVAQVSVAGTSLLLALAFANFLTPENYGTYKYILTILGILTITCLRGMDGILVQASARGNDGTVLPVLFAKMKWGLIGALASLCVGSYYWLHGNTTIAIGLFLAVIFIPIMDPPGIYASVLNGKKAFRLNAIFDSGSQIVTGLAIFIVLLTTHNILAVFFAYCLAWTIVRAYSLFITLRVYPPQGDVEPNALSYGKHASLISSGAMILSSLDGILIFHYLGATQLAIYTFAMAPILQMRGVFNALTTLATPKFTQKTEHDIEKTLVQRSLLLGGIGIAIAILYIIFAPYLYTLFFPRYTAAILYSRVFSITIALGLANIIVSSVLNSRITLIPRRLLYLWNAPGIVFTLASIFLIPIIGIWGAIAGQILSSLTGNIIGWFIWLQIRHRTFHEE